MKNLVIPYSVTEIGYLAFYNVQLVTYNTATSESIWKGEKNSRTVIQIAKNINIENINIENINIDDQAETKQYNNNPKHYNNYNNVQKQTVKYNNDNSNIQDTDNKKKGCWYWGALIVGILFVGAGTSFLIMEGGCENGCLFYILGILQYICLIVLVPTILMKFHLASCWFLGLTVVILLLCLIPCIGWGVSIITTIFLLCQLFF